MAILGADVHSALGLLLQALQSTDNEQRSKAEEALNNDWVNGRPDVLLMGLAEQIHESPDAGVSHP